MSSPVSAPMLATAGDLPSGDGWGFEFKWDGMRAVAVIHDGALRLYARSGADITITFPEIAPLANGIDDAVVDGELITLNAASRPSFARLSRRFHVRDAEQARQLAGSIPVTFMIFDLLRWGGTDLRSQPYQRRRTLLQTADLTGPSWQTPPFTTDGPATLAAATDTGLEGIVAKRLASAYQSGHRSRDWIKIKHTHTIDLVIGGWRTTTRTLGSILVGQPTPDGRLHYRGRVGSGISHQEQHQLLNLLQPLVIPDPPFTTTLAATETQGATWVEPHLVVEVTYNELTPTGRLRAPRFIRRRPDKQPEECATPGTRQ